jgi:translation initiation factor 2D
MFKKEINERSKTLLKNKESRAFKQNLIDQFRDVDADSLSNLFATKSQQVYVGKIGNGTKDVLYSISDNEPLAIDLNSKNQLLPTLYFLSKFPTALRQFVIHSPVSEYVLKGADLMMPGVCAASGGI